MILRLSPSQTALMRFIHGYQLAHAGGSPTQRTMAAALGRSSQGTVSRDLAICEARGHLRRLRKRPNAIELLRKPAIPFTPCGAPLFAVALRQDS